MKIGAWAWFVAVLLAGLLAASRAGAQNLAPKLSVDLGGGVKMDFVLIKAGSFQMGSEKGDPGEKPVHGVTITKPFYMGVYEVTQAQWKAIMGYNPSEFKGDDLPVECVSWEECQKFVAKLKEKAGQGMACRLPTEAEWEYACRAGSKTEYSYGDDAGALGEYAWFDGNSEGKTHPLGQKKPNAWGLCDMHGNVWEWCADWLDPGYYAKSPPEDPKGPNGPGGLPPIRVWRGGCWVSDAFFERSAFRGRISPSDRDYFSGCRVVMSAQE